MKNISDRVTPLLILAFIVMAFVIGALWQKVQMLEGGSSNKSANSNPTAQGTPAAAPSPYTKLTADQAGKITKVTDSDHIRGAQNPKVYLVEYSDYYCPYCSLFHPYAQEAIDEYSDSVAWVYRHFPLDSLHPNARPLAEISECIASIAGEDAFWKFTDAVYSSAPASAAAAIDLAATQGVNKAALQTCFDEGRFTDLVENQMQEGLSAGITGTPGVLILSANGEAWKLAGAVPFAQFAPVLDQALGK